MTHTKKSSTKITVRFSLKELKAIRLREMEAKKEESKKSLKKQKV